MQKSWKIFSSGVGLAASTWWLGTDLGAEQVFTTITVGLAFAGLAFFSQSERSNDEANYTGRDLLNTKLSEQFIQSVARIAFVDDEGAPIAARLRARGYNVFEFLDVNSAEELNCSLYHIVYLDVSGVAVKKHPDTQGAGIAKDLREKFPRPYIIVYSALAHAPGTTISKVLRDNTDDELLKDEEVDEHIESILRWSLTYFCGENLVAMVQAHYGPDSLLGIEDLPLLKAVERIEAVSRDRSVEARAIRQLTAYLAGSLLSEGRSAS